MGLKGYRLWAMGQLDSTRSAPPVARVRAAQHVLLRRRRPAPHLPDLVAQAQGLTIVHFISIN
jgi:hypothetical protein